MGAVFVEDRSLTAPTAVSGGTYFFDNALNITGPTKLVLADALFQTAGQYTIFDYSAAGGSFPGGQAALDTYVWPYIDSTALTKTVPISITDDPTAKKVYLLMGSGVEGNGTLYFDNGLVLTGPTNFYLSAAIAPLPGTYTICVVTGTFTGDSFIRVVPAAGLVPISVTRVGNKVIAVLV